MILLEVWTWRLEEVSLTANLSLTPGTKSHRAEEHTQLWFCHHHHLIVMRKDFNAISFKELMVFLGQSDASGVGWGAGPSVRKCASVQVGEVMCKTCTASTIFFFIRASV